MHDIWPAAVINPRAESLAPCCFVNRRSQYILLSVDQLWPRRTTISMHFSSAYPLQPGCSSQTSRDSSWSVRLNANPCNAVEIDEAKDKIAGEVKHNETGRASRRIERMVCAARCTSALLLLTFIAGFWTFWLFKCLLLLEGEEKNGLVSLNAWADAADTNDGLCSGKNNRL